MFPEVSPCLRVRLVLRRHSFIHIMGSYVPSGLFVLVGWTSFFWPAEVVPGRTVLVITSLLTITSMYTGIRSARHCVGSGVAMGHVWYCKRLATGSGIVLGLV